MANEYTVKVFGKKTKYRKVNGKFFRIKKDGTLEKDAATGLVLANLKNAAESRLVSGPGKTLDIVKSAAKESLRKKTKTDRRGTKQAIASPTKDDGGKAVADFARDIKKATKKTVTKTVNKKEVKDKKQKKKFTPFLLNKKEEPLKDLKLKKEEPLKDLKLKKVKENITKKIKGPPKEDKKVDKKETKTPNLKPFQGSYNQNTQKLVNIKGKTFVAPKSYEKPKSKTNPSFKRLLKNLGLNKGSYVGKPKTGHSDYRKSGLFK
jgi:hypothetical protein